MNLNPIKANMTELELDSGIKVLFSYKTPVAAIMDSGRNVYRTDKVWSNTTTRHINAWLGGASTCGQKRPQEFFDNLIVEGK